MFPSFISILDIQSWWEVPSIAYFCSLFRTAFNLLDFDIEELEEALLTDGTEESASSLLTELIVRLLNGCLGNNDISAFNYQMYLRRLFRRKCQDTGRYNPFNTDIDFQFLPLRTKVEILYALCDFRLDADDVVDLFKNLEAESLRVEPLGWDSNSSTYWYFYGTRLYREDIKKTKGKSKKKRSREIRKRGLLYGDNWLEEDSNRVWQVVCFTEEDWSHLTEKFSKATSRVEKDLYRSLSQNFLPEIPRLFQEKERLQRKRLLESAPRRTSNRVLQKIKQKEEDSSKPSDTETSKDAEDDNKEEELVRARETRAQRREKLRRSKSYSSDTSEGSLSESEKMPLKSASKRSKIPEKRSKNSSSAHKGEPPPETPVKTGRKTNNSLSSATGQILIPENDEPVNSTRKKLKTSQIFKQTDEDIQTDLYKVLEQLLSHDDAWPFLDPVEEEYAPNYYTVIRRPMDLHKMEERLDSGYYKDYSTFKADFKLIVNNCRLYNGQDNEYTTMVDNLQAAFDRLTEKYINRLSSSDEEIAVEYQIPTPSRKHKLKTMECPVSKKRKKTKSSSDAGTENIAEKEEIESTSKGPLHRTKEGKIKKKRKGHHRHGKHSKNHKKEHHKLSRALKRAKKQKHSKDKDGKKSKKKKNKHSHGNENENVVHSPGHESAESSNRSRSASPLPSIHTLSPTPPPSSPEHDSPVAITDAEFFKDKYDKIKERRRAAAKDTWESLFDIKQKIIDTQKQNLHIPEKDKNQKLTETIEKLKAKRNETYKDTSLFNSLFTTAKGKASSKKVPESQVEKAKNRDKKEESQTAVVKDKEKSKSTNKKTNKKATAKNESASEALEQAVKDISKWLDDDPKGSNTSSPSDSPSQTISTEEQDNSRHEDDFGDKNSQSKREYSKKRQSSREPKMIKRREIQRTIDRLQPGKSKGNLLTNASVKNAEKIEEVVSTGLQSKIKELNKTEESSPKLSLGSVLPTVKFTLGNDHSFDKDNLTKDENKANVETSTTVQESKTKSNSPVKPTTKAIDIIKEIPKEEPEPPIVKPSQEKATPNLSAWFKAFGTPKSSSTQTTVKKKTEDCEVEDKATETSKEDTKPVSPKNNIKYDSPTDPDTPNPDGGDSPLPNISNTPRQRRTSTGSSVSERSSFSQDLDSPRHQISHTSPLLRSPASPRTEDFQKITYPIINGTVRAGFYQDTTSVKSSPEKSCSPREGPQSPYSPYTAHVYASNASTTPQYFADHNKSPLPTYGQSQPPPYYDTTKVPSAAKPRVHEDYTSLGPDTYPTHYGSSYSPVHSPYPPNQQSNYAQPQISPQPVATSTTMNTNPPTVISEPKTTLFPVKKRTYNETENTTIAHQNVPDTKETTNQNKSDYGKAHTMSSMSDLSPAHGEKIDYSKTGNMRDKLNVDYIPDRILAENRSSISYENNEASNKRENSTVDYSKPIGMTKNDNVDMINMGYMNPESDRRLSDHNEHGFQSSREVPRTTVQPKGYEIDAIAMNLGMTNQNAHRAHHKSSINSTSVPAPYSHERTELISNHQMLQHPEFGGMPASSSTGQTVGNFSLNDIELANKKLYSCSSTQSNTALDYGNWKVTSQMRKPDVLPSDYSTSYSANNSEKLKSDMSSTVTSSINYNKNLIQQQYQNYNPPRSSIQNLPSELRIPNPRGLLKNDHVNVSTSLSGNDMISKNIESTAKTQKQDKLVQNHPLVGSLQYKTPYSAHSPLPLDSLRNLPNIPQMLERYSNDERYLSSFATGNTSLYHDKTFQMAQMFQKSIASDISAASIGGYSQPTTTLAKESSGYKITPSSQHVQTDAKGKTKRKRTVDTKQQQQQIMSNQVYTSSCSTDTLSSVKSSMVPGSAFNFGAASNMGLGSGLYSDNGGFTIEDFRNSTANQLMAANYMAAAAAAHGRAASESSDKLKSSHGGSSFPLVSGQVRAPGYGFMGDSGAPLYRQYLQRHQEELLRQTGAQIMGLYPGGYGAALAARQQYDAMDRPAWL